MKEDSLKIPVIIFPAGWLGLLIRYKEYFTCTQNINARDEVLLVRKDMSSLYFGLTLFCVLETGVPEIDTPPPPRQL
jgi:hypothetical protein